LRYKYGTRIDEKPSNKISINFEWRLLIYPPYRKKPTDAATVADVPLVLGEGNLEGALIEDRLTRIHEYIKSATISP
jgi:hypothetical protein